jgi:hypothetical protein
MKASSNNADACTASLQAAIKKVLHSAAFGKFVTDAMQTALVQESGELVLQPLRNGFIAVLRSAHLGGSVAIETICDSGSVCLYRDYQRPSDSERFKPGIWWGGVVRVDQNGKHWSSSIPDMVCNDFGELVEVAA